MMQTGSVWIILCALALVCWFPPPSAPAATLSSSPTSTPSILVKEAQGGVSAVAILEALNSPAALHTSKVQAFLDVAFQRFSALSPDFSLKDLQAMRDLLRRNDQAATANLQLQFLNFEDKLQATKPRDHQDAWMLGVRAMQIEYNALHSKDRTTANTLISKIALLSVLDQVFPAVHDLRSSLQTLQAYSQSTQTWPQQAAAANAIATIIAAAGTNHHELIAALGIPQTDTTISPPQPPSLSRLEIISADGQFYSISGYKDGPENDPFGRLHCGIDHLPLQSGVGSIPLTLPPTTPNGSPPSLTSIINACTVFEQTNPLPNFPPAIALPTMIIPHILITLDPQDWNFFLAVQKTPTVKGMSAPPN